MTTDRTTETLPTTVNQTLLTDCADASGDFESDDEELENPYINLRETDSR